MIAYESGEFHDWKLTCTLLRVDETSSSLGGLLIIDSFLCPEAPKWMQCDDSKCRFLYYYIQSRANAVTYICAIHQPWAERGGLMQSARDAGRSRRNTDSDAHAQHLPARITR